MFLSAFLFISCDNYSLRLAGKVNQEPTVTLEQKLSQKMAEMTEVAELGSVEYTVTKVVKASDDPSWYNYYGITAISSMEYENLAVLHRKLGAMGNNINSFYNF